MEVDGEQSTSAVRAGRPPKLVHTSFHSCDLCVIAAEAASTRVGNGKKDTVFFYLEKYEDPADFAGRAAYIRQTCKTLGVDCRRLLPQLDVQSFICHVCLKRERSDDKTRRYFPSRATRPRRPWLELECTRQAGYSNSKVLVNYNVSHDHDHDHEPAPASYSDHGGSDVAAAAAVVVAENVPVQKIPSMCCNCIAATGKRIRDPVFTGESSEEEDQGAHDHDDDLDLDADGVAAPVSNSGKSRSSLETGIRINRKGTKQGMSGPLQLQLGIVII